MSNTEKLVGSWHNLFEGSQSAIQWVSDNRTQSQRLDNEADSLILELRRLRNTAKRLGESSSHPVTAGFFGLSQAGKSYLISALAADKQGKLQLKRVDTEKRKGWAENEFSFDNTDLRQVMQDIGSWYNISIVFRSRPLLDERIYFHINRQLPVNTVLDALNDLKIAQFTMKEGKIIVEPPQDKKR